jgi:hypothetical protein
MEYLPVANPLIRALILNKTGSFQGISMIYFTNQTLITSLLLSVRNQSTPGVSFDRINPVAIE